MNFDARLKKVEEQAQEQVRAGFCPCVLDEELSAIFRGFLSDRGVVYEPENPYIVTQPCAICRREVSWDLTTLDEEERAAWLRVSKFVRDGWEEKRRTGRTPEIPEEFARLGKWWKHCLPWVPTMHLIGPSNGSAPAS